MNQRFEDDIAELRLELAKEREAEREEFQREWLSLPLKERCAVGVSLHPVEAGESHMVVEGKWRVRFSYSGRRGRFQAGQWVRLFWKEERLQGILSWVGRRELDIVVEDLPDWLEESGVGLDMEFQETTFLEMEKTLVALLNEKDHDAKVLRESLVGNREPDAVRRNPEREELYRYRAGSREIGSREDGTGTQGKIKVADPIADPILDPLNESQRAAVLGVAAVPDFALIHGPPGTGKTTTLVATVRYLLRDPEERILVAAPTNAAVDILTEMLSAYGIRLLRLGHPARVRDALLRYTLDGRLEERDESALLRKYRREAEELRRKAKRYRRNFGAKERQEREDLWKEFRELRRIINDMERSMLESVLRESRVVLATPVASIHPLLRDIRFTTVFLDEATQALEPAAWIPLRRGKKIVMAGDHRQLPPTVKSNSARLKRTLFERAMAANSLVASGTVSVEGGGGDRNRAFFLDLQYRMEPEILGFSNLEFYDGRLRTHDSVLQRRSFPGDPFLSSLVFVDTAGADCTEEKDERTESLRNRGEAGILLSLLRRHLPTLREEGFSAAIISAYRSQADLIADLLIEEYGENSPAESDTVDSFQGGERDWIGISLVRSNDEGETGFLSEIRRINVALTRARRMLIVVGDGATLSTHPFYARFLEYMEKNGDYRSAYDPELQLELDY